MNPCGGGKTRRHTPLQLGELAHEDFVLLSEELGFEAGRALESSPQGEGEDRQDGKSHAAHAPADRTARHRDLAYVAGPVFHHE